MSDSFEDKPFSGKGRNMAMWIYWPKNYCWSKDTANCEGLFTVGIPINPSSYPSAKSSEYVLVQKHEKASNVDVKPTTCKAPWWIESTYKTRDTWAFAVSITCLGIPKEFGWYAFSQIDIGQKDVVSDFTQVQTITYPFHELAASAAKNSQSSSNGGEKSDLINRLKQLSKSGKSQSKALSTAILKTKKLSSMKRKSYQVTVREYNLYVKEFDGQISELKTVPYGEDFKAQALDLITEHQSWLRKLIDILGGLVKK